MNKEEEKEAMLALGDSYARHAQMIYETQGEKAFRNSAEAMGIPESEIDEYVKEFEGILLRRKNES